MNTNDTIRLEIEKRKRFEEKAKNSLKNFWEKNEQKFLSLSEGNIEQNLSSNNLTSTNKRGNKLHSISLFKKVEEKKILAKIIPEKELEKYDKRYQMIYNEKKNLQRLLKFEEKKLKNEKLEMQVENRKSQDKVCENQGINEKLEDKIEGQKKEIDKLNKKLNDISETVKEKEKELININQENEKLKKQIKEFSDKYEKKKII